MTCICLFQCSSLFTIVFISMYSSISMLHINPEWDRSISEEIEARLGGDIMLIIIDDGQTVDGVWQTVALPPAKDDNTACCVPYHEMTTLRIIYFFVLEENFDYK